MTEPTPDPRPALPWPAGLGGATVNARIMYADADADDPNLDPDAVAPHGTVEFVYPYTAYTYQPTDDSPRVLITPRRIVCQIRPDGTLEPPEPTTDGALVLMPTDAPGLTPSGSTITATIKLNDLTPREIAKIRFTAAAGDSINLADHVEHAALPGVVVIVNEALTDRAETAATTAETAAGTATAAATSAGNSAATATAAASTATAARDATLAASTIVGAGRPDIPATLTPEVAALVSAATSGAIFRSIDGPQGAWEWQKRGTAWTVTSGDTGWREISSSLVNGWTGEIHISRTPQLVHFRVFQLSGGLAPRALDNIPAGFRPNMARNSRYARPLFHVADTPAAGSTSTTATRRFTLQGTTLDVFAVLPIPAVYGDYSTVTADSWPVTLPGV